MVKDGLHIIENILPLEESSIHKGLFLCLFGTDKIPPHLGLIADGKYYSSSAKGSRIGEDLEIILRKVKQSEIPTLFIELGLEINQPKLVSAFENYPKLTKNQTCLLPIKAYLNSIRTDVSFINFVYELVPLLQEKEMILNTFSLNMNVASFRLETYTKQDITNRIVKLQETC